MLNDDDWRVRWAALGETARREKRTPAEALKRWLGKASGEALRLACLTAAHASPPLPSQCEAEAASVRDALRVQLYAEALSTRADALTALAAAFSQPRARVVLDVLPTRPADFDALVFDTLVEASPIDGRAALGQLLDAAGPGDVATMNRLLAVAARRRDEARPRLASADTRREAIRTLRALLPSSEPELFSVLRDGDVASRGAAMRAVASHERRSVSLMAAPRFAEPSALDATQQRALLELLGDVHDADCSAVALALWNGSGPLKAPALRVAASCDWVASQPAVSAALRDDTAPIRAAAVDALAHAPMSAQLKEQLQFAANAEAPVVRAAAARAIAAKRWRAGASHVKKLVDDADPDVREAALTAATALDAPGLEQTLMRALTTDAAPRVRSTAAELLGRAASPRTEAALVEAAKNETDSAVKMVVERALRTIRGRESSRP